MVRDIDREGGSLFVKVLSALVRELLALLIDRAQLHLEAPVAEKAGVGHSHHGNEERYRLHLFCLLLAVLMIEIYKLSNSGSALWPRRVQGVVQPASPEHDPYFRVEFELNVDRCRLEEKDTLSFVLSCLGTSLFKE